MPPKPLLEEATRNINFDWMLDSLQELFFPGKFPSNPLMQFRRIVVSSEKITWFQAITLWSLNELFDDFRRVNGFDKGRLYFAAASFKHRCTVLPLILIRFLFNWLVISRLVTNVCCSASEIICWSCFGVVTRARPVRSESFKFFDCLCRLSQYSAVDVLHLTAFDTDLWSNFGPNGCWDKKMISHHWCIGKAIVQN